MIESKWKDLSTKYDKMSGEQMNDLAREMTRQAINDAALDVDMVMGRGTAEAQPVLVAGAMQVMATALQTIAITRAIQRHGGSLTVELEDAGKALSSIAHSMP